MGNQTYSVSNRSIRAVADNYATATTDALFTQQKERKIHELMDPKTIEMRVSHDSETNPLTMPIILGLDVTGSMGMIPDHLLREGLPKLMGSLVQHGVNDPALLFIAIGDHDCDDYPLQVAQFESGDKELDEWLRRVYIEKGGGGNNGESYLLAWYFAAFHTQTDSWEKRKKKGYLFTVGDEPCLEGITVQQLGRLMKNKVGEHAYTHQQLLERAKEQWNVYHLNIMQGTHGRSSIRGWRELLGDHLINIEDYTTIPQVMYETILEEEQRFSSSTNQNEVNTEKQNDIIL